MISNITAQQVFAWVESLTAQPDYQALTHQFLNILAGIDKASAYEIDDRGKKKTGETDNACDQLIRRFPLDFTNDETEEHDLLLNGLDSDSNVIPVLDEGNGICRRVILSIKYTKGHDRIIASTAHDLSKPGRTS